MTGVAWVFLGSAVVLAALLVIALGGNRSLVRQLARTDRVLSDATRALRALPTAEQTTPGLGRRVPAPTTRKDPS